MQTRYRSAACRLVLILGLLLAYGSLPAPCVADTNIINRVVFNWPNGQVPFCQDQVKLLDEMGVKVGEPFDSTRSVAMQTALGDYLRLHAAGLQKIDNKYCNLDVDVELGKTVQGVLSVTVSPAAYPGLTVKDVVVDPFSPESLSDAEKTKLHDDAKARIGSEVTAIQLSQLPGYLQRKHEDLLHLACEYRLEDQLVHIHAGKLRTVSAVRVEVVPSVSDATWEDKDGGFRRRYNDICEIVKKRAEELNQTASVTRTDEDISAELRQAVGARYYDWGYLAPTINIKRPPCEYYYGMYCVQIAEGPTAKANELSLTAAQSDSPSDEPTGSVRVVLGNFRRRHEQLAAEGSIGGTAGGTLSLSAVTDYVHSRPWTIAASHVRTPEVKIGSAEFDETKTAFGYCLPPYARAGPNRTGWRYQWSRERLRPTDTGSPLDVDVGLLGGTYIHDPGKFLPDAPPSTRTDDDQGPEPQLYQVDLDLGSQLLGGDAYFAVVQAETRRYWHLTGKCLLAARLAAGYCTTDTPLTEQLVIGGDTAPGLLRAHEPQAFRGNQTVNANVEFRYGIAEQVDGVLFVDAASVTDGPNPTHGFVADYGIGFRAVVPAGGSSFPLSVFYGRDGGTYRLGFALSRGF